MPDIPLVVGGGPADSPPGRVRWVPRVDLASMPMWGWGSSPSRCLPGTDPLVSDGRGQPSMPVLKVVNRYVVAVTNLLNTISIVMCPVDFQVRLTVKSGVKH